MVNLTIDGRRVSVPEGTTILAAARKAGLRIPTLCYLKDINEIGACRMCVVEVEGQDHLVASCNAPAVEERRDYKTTLQEVVQRRSGQVLTYHMLSQSGPDHNKTFLFEVRLNGEAIGQGQGHSKKEAEQAAARDALDRVPQ